MKTPFPFAAIVGQDEMRRALILTAIDPRIGGVLIFGDRGTGKSTAVRALAASPGLLEASPEQQHAWLQAYKAAYPDAAVLTLFSADGRQIARGDDLPLGPPITPEIVAQLRETRNLRLAVILARSIERPVSVISTTR